MLKRYLKLSILALTAPLLLALLTACSNTIQGMRDDINGKPAPRSQVTVVKRTTVVQTQGDLPSSPPPMQSPPPQ